MNYKSLIISLIIFFNQSLAAQMSPEDEIENNFFPPELVMRAQSRLQLKPEQKALIIKQTTTAQVQFTELEWEIQAEMEKLLHHLQQQAVDENAALKLLDTVTELEAEVKRTHFKLLIRIKNALNQRQQNVLQELKQQLQQQHWDEQEELDQEQDYSLR